RGRARAVALSLREERGQRARERVDLMRVERRAVGEPRLVVAEYALEAEHERVAAAPVRRRHRGARVELGQGRVEGEPATRPRGQRVREVLALVDEPLAREPFGTRDGFRIRNR